MLGAGCHLGVSLAAGQMVDLGAVTRVETVRRVAGLAYNWHCQRE